MNLFTNKHRDLLSKTLMDINKILIAAIFANEFFLKFSMAYFSVHNFTSFNTVLCVIKLLIVNANCR